MPRHKFQKNNKSTQMEALVISVEALLAKNYISSILQNAPLRVNFYPA